MSKLFFFNKSNKCIIGIYYKHFKTDNFFGIQKV